MSSSSTLPHEESWLDSISPISTSSRLLKPINQVRVRIPPETITKTSQQTQVITKKTYEANHKTKSRVLSELHNRLKVNQQERERQVNAWIQKTKNCPYRLDQNEVDMQAYERGRERNKRKQFNRNRKKLLQSMTGEPNMEFYSDTLKSSLTTEQLLAMEHLTLLKTLNKLKEEQDQLTEMLHSDCNKTELQFAYIAMKKSYERGRARTASLSMNNTRASSIDYRSIDSNGDSCGSGGGDNNWQGSGTLLPIGGSGGGGGGDPTTRDGRNNSLSWGNLSAPKIDASRARQWKKMDATVYSADGKWNESGQFVPARKPEDKLGLMSAKYARITGDSAPEVLTRRRKTDIFKLEMTS